MLSRQIPSTGESLPTIGLGTWRTFDVPATPEALTPLANVLKEFYDLGGRLVDSSPMYGKSESVVGQLTDRLGINEDLFIATKVWIRGEDAGVRQMQQSMAKLRRDRIELMQIHNLVDWRSQIKTLRQWKQEEKFRYIGVTHWQESSFADLEYVVRREKMDFIQLPYSVLQRGAEKRILPLAQDLGLAVLVSRPFAQGDIFGSVRGVPLPEFIRPFATTWSQALLKWVLAHPAVTCVIPATHCAQHLRDNMQAGDGPLPDERTRERFAAIVAELQQPVAG